MSNAPTLDIACTIVIAQFLDIVHNALMPQICIYCRNYIVAIAHTIDTTVKWSVVAALSH